MDGPAKKTTAFVLALLLLGAAIPGQACREPYMLDGPGTVPIHLRHGKLYRSLPVLDQIPLGPAGQSDPELAPDFVVGKDRGFIDGQVEILAVALEEGILQGHEVQGGKGKMEKIPQDRLEGLLMSCPKSPVWFTISPEHRESWLEGPPSHNINMLLDSYEIHVGRKEGFG